jgi:hypothetical protein
MKHNFTVRQAGLEGVGAFPSVAQHRNFRRAEVELEATNRVDNRSGELDPSYNRSAFVTRKGLRRYAIEF